MSISERATALIKEMPRDPNDINRLREEWRLAANAYNAANDKARRYEEGRKVYLAKLKLGLIDAGFRPLTLAEDRARTSEQFRRFLKRMFDARRIADDLETEMIAADRIYWERKSADATERSERRTSR